MTLSHHVGHFYCKHFKCYLLYSCEAADKISTDIARRAVPPRVRGSAASCTTPLDILIL